MRTVVTLLLLLVAIVAAKHELNYRVGQTVVYDMNSHVQHGAQGSKNATLETGTQQAMTGTSMAKCIQLNADNSMVFAYNMFDVNVTTNEPADEDDDDVVSETTPVTSGLTTHLSSHLSAISGNVHEPAGADAYYVQDRDGTISRVWFAANNEAEANALLLGGINALQVQMADDKPSRPLANDVTGEHYVNCDAVHDVKDSLTMTSGFTRDDFVQFNDAALDTSSVKINHATSASVAPTRHITSVSQQQTFVLMAGNNADELIAKYTSDNADEDNDGDDTDKAGFDSVITSMGSHSFAEDESMSVRAAELEASHPEFLMLSSMDLDAMEGLVGGSLREHAIFHSERIMSTVPEIDLEEEVATILSEDVAAVDRVRAMDQLADWVRLSLAGTQKFVDAVEAVAVVEELHQEASDAVFYILAVSGTTAAQTAIVNFGINSDDEATKLMSIVATQNIKAPTSELLQAVRVAALPVLETSSNSPAAGVAVLALGTAAGRSLGDARDAVLTEISTALHRHLSTEDGGRAVLLVNALSNANATNILHKESVTAILSALDSENESVARAAAIVIVEETTIEALASIKENFESGNVGSSYPWNYSWDKSLNLGGSKIGIANSMKLFLGANLDCNHTSFRYKALARVLSMAHAFGFGKTVLKAEFEYAHSGTTLVADHILLKVWGRKIYDYHLGNYGECKSTTKSLFNTGKGFDVGFTYYVVVIPVKFYVGASFSVSASYGWEVCPGDLRADVYALPAGTLSIYGGASASIYVVRGGIEAKVNLGTSFKPEGQINGNQCQAKFLVTRIGKSMDASIYGWYQHKKFHCHHWHCHFKWSDKKTKTFWSWVRPAESTVIYNKVYPFHGPIPSLASIEA